MGRYETYIRDKTMVWSDRDKRNEWYRNYWHKVKLNVMIYYSSNPPKCACCGEEHIEFLTMDHINGGGIKHRKEVKGAYKLCLWLKKNNYPEGFRVLCMNCNHFIGRNSQYKRLCPHQGGD